MCIRDAKTNIKRLGILLLLRCSSITCIRWSKLCSFLFYLCIFPHGYYLVTFFTCLNFSNIFCSAISQLLDMSLWRCIMRSSSWRMITPPSSLRSGWKRQWNWLGRTTTLFFANTFICVISPLAWISSKKSKFIMTWTSNRRCSQRHCRC